MAMRVTVALVTVLVSWGFFYTSAEDKITLVSFPVNVTSWKERLQDKLSHPLDDVPSKLKHFIDNTVHGSVGCVDEGRECEPQMPNCCSDMDDALRCSPTEDSGAYVCRRVQSSEEMAQQRLNSLQYGDSKGVMNSHPWVDSWEFQSRSTMEREEEKAAADDEFTRNFKPSQGDNVWEKVYTKLKSGGQSILNDLKKLEKLREIKNNLIKKYMANYENNDNEQRSSEVEDVIVTTSTTAVNELTEQAAGTSEDNIRYPESNEDVSWLYPSDNSESTDHGRTGPFNRVQKSKKRKNNKIQFRIEDIIEDVTNLLNKKLKEKIAINNGVDDRNPSVSQDPLHPNNIMDSAERLRKEINELKKLKEKHANSKTEQNLDKTNNDELIRKHVSEILDEERKLDKLKKLEVFKKLQEVR